MLPSLESLREIVCTAAREELLPRFAAGKAAKTTVTGYSDPGFADITRHIKHDGSVVTAADRAMQDRLQQELARHWPEYDFLGEEMPGHEHEKLMAASTGAGMWCLDPLDGTSNFASGIPFFAVSLALIVDGRPEIGLVYDPVRDECFMARRGAGAWRNDVVLGAHQSSAPEMLHRCLATVDFKRLTAPLAARLGAQPPYGSQRNFGASSLEWCWLADDRFHLYLHGGQKLWDYAAGSLILAEAGGVASTLEDESVFALGLAPRSVVAAIDPKLYALWKTWIDSTATRTGTLPSAPR